jgi:hypothetical protein
MSSYMERQVMGYPDPPFPPAMPAPEWPADGLQSDGENARSVVDSLVGKPKAATLEDSFSLIFAKLSRDPKNADLIGELEGLRLAIVERLETQRAAHLADLQTRHDETYMSCRDMLDKRDALQKQLNGLDGHVHAAGERLSRARAAWMSARNRRPDARSYPTWTEIEAWKGEVSEAQGRLDTEAKAYNELVAQQADLARQLAEANKELNRLVDEESALKAQLEGRAFSDPAAHGLIRPPEQD